jgi:type IV pilus assembly protein PilM
MLFHNHKYTLGCDISDDSIKMVQLRAARKRNKLISYNRARLSEGIIQDGEIKKVDEFIKVLKKLIKNIYEKKLLTKNINVNIPDAKSFIKLLQIKNTDDEDLPHQIKKELGKHLPMDLNEMYFDYAIIKRDNNKLVCLVAAAPKETSDSYYNAFKKCGLDVLSLEIESLALTRALAGGDLSKPLLLLDFGHSRSTLTVIDKNSIQLSLSIPLTGDHINQTIAEKLKIKVEQAEKAKITCGLVKDKCKGALPIVLNSAMDELAFKIEDAITFYQSENKNASHFSQIIITGGGANFLNIENVLKEKTKREIIQGTSTLKINIEPVQKELSTHNDTLHFLTLACGLALKDEKDNL